MAGGGLTMLDDENLAREGRRQARHLAAMLVQRDPIDFSADRVLGGLLEAQRFTCACGLTLEPGAAVMTVMGIAGSHCPVAMHASCASGSRTMQTWDGFEQLVRAQHADAQLAAKVAAAGKRALVYALAWWLEFGKLDPAMLMGVAQDLRVKARIQVPDWDGEGFGGDTYMDDVGELPAAAWAALEDEDLDPADSIQRPSDAKG